MAKKEPCRRDSRARFTQVLTAHKGETITAIPVSVTGMMQKHFLFPEIYDIMAESRKRRAKP